LIRTSEYFEVMQFRLTPINREAQQDSVIASNTNRSNPWLS